MQTGIDHGRPQAVQVRRRATSTSSRPPRCARRGTPSVARRLRQHAGDRREDRRLRRGVRVPQPDAAVPGAGGRDRGVLAAQGGRFAGCDRRFPGGRPGGTVASRPSTSSASSSRWASRRTSSSSPTWSRYAKRQGIRVGPGRGSAAGALIAYALGITELDPIAHGLIFERFLNPERVSMPDIDIDFDERRRGDMIRYVTEKYGDDRVAQIVTFGTIKAKAAIKDSARVLGYPFAVGDRITKAMPPPVMGKDIPLSGIFDPQHPRYAEAGEFRGLYESDPDVQKVVDTAQGPRGAEAAERACTRPASSCPPSRSSTYIPLRCASSRRRDHHPVRLPDLRDARPAQDGLPRPAQPDHHRRRAEEHRAQPRRRARPAESCRWTTGRPTSCWPGATRSGCSSSTAGRCARCCG